MYNLNKIIYLPDTHLEAQSISDFFDNWYNEDTFIETKTSGSTGVPKLIRLQKQHMKASACATIDFFDLNENKTACLCLSASTIAGKMLLVRVFEANMNLVIAPIKSDFFKNIDQPVDFIPLVPMQMSALLASNKLFNFKIILIGGAAISPQLEKNIIEKGLSCYASFGMTETISHIAIRKIDEKSISYKAINGVTFSQKNNNLIIHAEHLELKNLETTDVVELLNEKEFIWLGRSDFVINSAGNKIHPESVERKIGTLIDIPFFVFGKNDTILGQAVCIVFETNTISNIEALLPSFSKFLDKYELPKHYFFLPKFELLSNQKINRLNTVLKLAL